MEPVAKIKTALSPKNVANTSPVGRKLPAVPVLQQKIKDQEEALLQKMPAPAGPPFAKSASTPTTMPLPDDNRSFTAFALQKPAQVNANNAGLSGDLKSNIENISGFSMDDVKVHYNSDRPAQLQALAYAQGTDIHIGPGQEKHLPHEAWHVVQQKQGRVQPTMQMKGGVNVNDDAGLEKEADTMGSKATAQRFVYKSVQQAKLPVPNSQEPVQRVMSVEDFKAATPGGSVFNKRTQGGVQLIDADLGTYTGNRTAVNAATLITTLNIYIAGNHDPDRIGVATNLRTRVQNEQNLLVAITDANAFLIDGLINQVGIANFNDLHTLATVMPSAKASLLPSIISEVGVPNINDPNLLALIPVMGITSMGLLTDLITNSGGVAQLANLQAIVNRHPLQGDLAFDLTREAGGNAVKFNRLAAEAQFFQQQPVPIAPPAGVSAARTAYNVAKAAFFAGGSTADITAQLNQLVIQATAAHARASAIGGIAAGLLGQVNARIAGPGGLGVRVAARLAGVAAVPADMILANILQNIIAGGLNNQMNIHHPGDAAFAIALAGINEAYDTAKRMTTSEAAPAPQDIAQISWKHFLERHTPHHFDFGEIKDENTQWYPAWAGGADAQVEAQLIHILNTLAANRIWLEPNVALQNQAVPMGGTATIAGELRVPGFVIGQFFPNPNGGNQAYPGSTMRAMFKVL